MRGGLLGEQRWRGVGDPGGSVVAQRRSGVLQKGQQLLMGVNVEFAIDTAAMGLHRIHRNMQVFGNEGLVAPAREQRDDLRLPGRQPVLVDNGGDGRRAGP